MGENEDNQDKEKNGDQQKGEKPRPTRPGSDIRDLPPVDPRTLKEPK